ncbi:MAG: type VI secretion system baseplate subunit TssF [Planctomycetes bacterium]|nr:type VI secretion system baseplate subunit TssF [Planctomycetota bacterium]
MSSLPKYYHDELAHLRGLGREFARIHPGAAPHLAAEGSDPDVERLLEGFAFLTARIRQKLDDDLPELTHAVLDLFWPGFLRPIPSMAVVEFSPMPQARDVVEVARGAVLESVPIDGARCRFRTAYDVAVTPVRLSALTVVPDGGGCLRLTFDLPEGASRDHLGLQRLRLHFGGEGVSGRWLRQALFGACRGVQVVVDGHDPVALPADAIRPVGFVHHEALLPDAAASMPALRLLQEYFAFPAKFLFLDLIGLDRVAPMGTRPSFTVVFQLERLPEGMPQLTAADVVLNCTPVVNLFACDGDPIRVDHRQGEYRVRAAGHDPSHAEVYAIDRVEGGARGSDSRTYAPLYHRGRRRDDRSPQYQLRRRCALDGDGSDVAIAVTSDPASRPETLSLALTCTNRQLAASLGIGDIRVPGAKTPTGVRCRNRTRPTPPIAAPSDGAVHWQMLSHLGLNVESLVDIESLRRLLDLYDRRPEAATASRRRVEDGIVSVRSAPATRLVDGLPVRGIAIELTMAEEQPGSAGDQHLLVSLLDELFSQYVSLNSFSQLTVVRAGGVVSDRRPARLGGRALL